MNKTVWKECLVMLLIVLAFFVFNTIQVQQTQRAMVVNMQAIEAILGSIQIQTAVDYAQPHHIGPKVHKHDPKIRGIQ